MVDDCGYCLENLLPVLEYNKIMNNMGEHEVFVKQFNCGEQKKILEYVKGMPARGAERAEKENAIECIIVRYEGRDYYTKNESTIGAFIEAAIIDLEAREELRQEAKKHGFDILKDTP